MEMSESTNGPRIEPASLTLLGPRLGLLRTRPLDCQGASGLSSRNFSRYLLQKRFRVPLLIRQAASFVVRHPPNLRPTSRWRIPPFPNHRPKPPAAIPAAPNHRQASRALPCRSTTFQAPSRATIGPRTNPRTTSSAPILRNTNHRPASRAPILAFQNVGEPRRATICAHQNDPASRQADILARQKAKFTESPLGVVVRIAFVFLPTSIGTIKERLHQFSLPRKRCAQHSIRFFQCRTYAHSRL